MMTVTKVAENDFTIVDNKLFKAICLHQLLDPTRSGNRYKQVAFQVLLWVSFGVQTLQLVGLYSMIHDLQRFAFTTMTMANAFMGISKGYVVMAYADRLRAGLEAARYGFTSCGAQNQRTMRRCRAVLSTVLRTFVMLSWFTCVVWAVGPLFTMGDYLSVTNADGTVSRYRATIYNVWLPVPVSVYNSPSFWTLVYAVEITVCFVNVFSWVLFDSYVVTMCFTFNAQFHTVSASSATIGHRHRSKSPPLCALGTHSITSYKNTLHFYDDLINHIKDTQNIIKKYDDFFKVIRPVILFQIIGGSYLVINIVLLTSLTYLEIGSIISIEVLKMFFGLMSLIFELFIYCYIFNYIETEKASMNFGLYSSNWTEMDLKFKKTLLLSMNMNSAHSRVMRVTPTSILNLDMFASVMNLSYSIVSVLLNSRART